MFDRENYRKIDHRHMAYLSFLDNSFYEFAYIDDGGDVVFHGQVGPVVVEYCPDADTVIFYANGKYCSLKGFAEEGANPYSRRDVSAFLRGALTEGDWKIEY